MINIFEGLGRLYVTHEAYIRNMDENKEGLSKSAKDVIEIYCTIKK
ncbi:TipAS antibiotic-recognition domain-containing protein [Anaeromicrobium sp.]